MAVFFYTIFLGLYRAGALLASLFDQKAKKWIKGRKNIFERLEKTIPTGEKIIWVHCASLGEFEQGRPVIERIKTDYPGHRILLTFFSPSGYEIQKNYSGADWVFYLPFDGPRNARRFLGIVKPVLVIFVKYEFWYYYLKLVHSAKIPLILISGIFRKDSIFFKWWGGLHRKMLTFFDHLFLQNEDSKKGLEQINISSNCSVTGDTRFDRVAGIAEKSEPISLIEQFLGKSKAIIAGSTWSGDERILQKAFEGINDPSLKLIIAPHEIHEKHLVELEKLFPSSVRFSELQTPDSRLPTPDSRLSSVLIIDNIGMLSRLYKYAYITYVGGGFNNGIHNILEAAVYNKIVLFGPVHQKFAEAIDLINNGGGLALKDDGRLLELISSLISNKEEYEKRSKAAGDYVQSNRGATQKIIDHIQEKRLLTN